MSETRTRLTALCRAHHIDAGLIERSRDLGQVIDLALAECERTIDDGGSGADERLRELRGLVTLVQETRTLRNAGSSLDQTQRELDRVGRELERAEASTKQLQRQLEESMAELDADAASTGRCVDIQSLGELFGAVSKMCHKINNPLTSIMGRAQMLQMKAKQGALDEQVAKSIGIIEESAKRVAALVQEQANLVCQGRKEFVESYDSSSGSR